MEGKDNVWMSRKYVLECGVEVDEGYAKPETDLVGGGGLHELRGDGCFAAEAADDAAYSNHYSAFISL